MYRQITESLDAFDPTLDIEGSRTPPYTWYTTSEFYEIEVERVFQRCWIPVGRLDQVCALR